MQVGDYVRTKYGKIGKIVNISKNRVGTTTYLVEWGNCKTYYVSQVKDYKSNPNILKLLEPEDLLYVDIDNGFEGGIIVPRIPETLNELNNYIKQIESGKLILKGVVTHEQLENDMYEVGE